MASHYKKYVVQIHTHRHKIHKNLDLNRSNFQFENDDDDKQQMQHNQNKIEMKYRRWREEKRLKEYNRLRFSKVFSSLHLPINQSILI